MADRFKTIVMALSLCILMNKAMYTHKLKKIYTAPIPVMVIGNITVGGSGKTPLLIQLVKYLQSKGLSVGVISRGYGGLVHFQRWYIKSHRLRLLVMNLL